MKCPIEPLGDRIVLLPIDEGEQQYGSIIVPDMGKEKPEDNLPVDLYPTVMIRVNEEIKNTIKGYNQPNLITELKKH